MIKIVSALGVALLSVSAVAKPMRIISLNPCLDAILVRVAEPSQIAALSSYSRDPQATSLALSIAQRFASTRGTADDVILRKSDLVLGSVYETPQLRAALKKYAIPLDLYDIANSVDENFAQIRAIALKTGNPHLGAALIADIQHALDVNAAPASRKKINTLVYRSEGLVLGAGTLTADLLMHTGFHNASETYGIKAFGILPLEKLVRNPPELLLRASNSERRGRLLYHPILNRGKITMRDFPARSLNCGGPSIIDAVQALAKIRDTL
jgi:iron complex transport system substrate-binding protein